MTSSLHLQVLPQTLAVCRLPADADVPPWAVAARFFSLTRTEDEMSVVCPDVSVPAGVESEGGWQALKVQGPLDFSLTGVLASLAAPLAEAGIPIFALSTFETDYLLVKENQLQRAMKVLAQAGHGMEGEGLGS